MRNLVTQMLAVSAALFLSACTTPLAGPIAGVVADRAFPRATQQTEARQPVTILDRKSVV